MPPVWNQREPSLPKISSQSIWPGLSWLTAVWPRSEQPSAARTPKPRSVKLRPLRVVRPTPSYLVQTTMRLVDAALQHQVFEETADGVVGERGDDGGLEAEAAAQASGYVVLAAALPDVEAACGGYADVAGIEAEHDFAEADDVPFALVFWADDKTLVVACGLVTGFSLPGA